MEEELDPNHVVKVLDPNTTEFTAGGHVYFVNMDIERLAVGRLQKYEQFQIELGFSIGFDTLFEAIGNAANLLFEKKDYQGAYIELKNLQRGIARVSEERNNMALWLCTLFINRAGEDVTFWDREFAETKIRDWETEGIAATFFLGFALSMVESYRQRFNSTLEEYEMMSSLSKQLFDTETT